MSEPLPTTKEIFDQVGNAYGERGQDEQEQVNAALDTMHKDDEYEPLPKADYNSESSAAD